MATDFSALCPLFNTGVYSELTIPGPLLQDNLASTTTKLAGILFGRSVIVTAAYLAKMTALATVSSNPTVKLYRQASWASSTATCFASFEVSKTTTVQILNKWLAFTMAAAKTFSATQWLTVRGDKGRLNGKSIFGVIVRYKEK
jgi:hypothetical protein